MNLPLYDFIYQYNIYFLVLLAILFFINKFFLDSNIVLIIILVIAVYCLYITYKKIRNAIFPPFNEEPMTNIQLDNEIVNSADDENNEKDNDDDDNDDEDNDDNSIDNEHNNENNNEKNNDEDNNGDNEDNKNNNNDIYYKANNENDNDLKKDNSGNLVLLPQPIINKIKEYLDNKTADKFCKLFE